MLTWLRVDRVRHALKVGPAGLNNGERLALLSDPVALARLHEQVWSEGHAEWLGGDANPLAGTAICLGEGSFVSK